jgi:uncharacterized membrane protein YphA (DoxX/SURF4 family)
VKPQNAAAVTLRKEPVVSKTRNISSIALWILQGVLAALFLFAGGFKLAAPMADLARVSPLPAPFLKFIGACELLGALGLVLPGLFRVLPGLTAVAASGLVIIMLGAVVVTAEMQNLLAAIFPLGVGVLATVVVVGRRPAVPRAIAGPARTAVDFRVARSS